MIRRHSGSRVICLTGSKSLYLALSVVVLASAGPVDNPARLPEASSKEPGPAWDPRPAWQRATDGSWRAIFRKRPVVAELSSEIVPVAGNAPFRIPRAMTPLPVEVAPPVTPLPQGAPGRMKFSACTKQVNYLPPKSTAAEDQRFIATMEKVIAVLKSNPAFPPQGFEVAMSCGFERRTDGTGIYQGRITMLFYPDSDKNHYWHGGLEVLVNDLGVMGPRANGGDRASDGNLVFDSPSLSTYRGKPWVPAEHSVWGGMYLTKHAGDIYKPVTYREWINENLPRLEAEYAQFKARAEAAPTVRNNFVRRNYQSMYERSLITSQRMPAAELDTPVWLYDLAPSDAVNTSATQQVRLNVPGYFNRKLPVHAIQLINILPMHSKYNHLHVVLEKLDYTALEALIQ
ncbi:MAG TPA: hypothetical protein VES20_02935 [Bryobacteraceae bacterium]|nr:hypothetical protein [Bryobacteraceae bacterium]